MVRIYHPGYYTSGQQLELSTEASLHVSVVLRMKIGEKITLFSGDGRELEAIISALHKKKVLVTLLTEQIVSRESSCIIHLAQAISKGERMELIVQKAVELGVASIRPLITERCVVRIEKERWGKKINQWRGITIAACEQSGRNQLPAIAFPCSLSEYLQDSPTPSQFVLCPHATQKWRDCNLNQSEIRLLVGPEGGFNKKEMNAILSAGFNAISLGPRVLRTETAAIAALSILQAITGDL